MEDFIKDCVEWDVTNWSKALRFWERNVELEKGGLQCLELGGRSGGLSLWLASKGHHVICSDLENPKTLASQVHTKYSLGGTIVYEAIDATNIPYNNKFDIIVFKSILGGISRDGRTEMKRKTLDEIYKALKPGGKLLFSENMSASSLHRFLRKRMVRWGASWNYLQMEEIPHLFEKFEKTQFEYKGFLASFGRKEIQRRLMGWVDTLLFDWLSAKRARYIVYGVASKSNVQK